MKIISTIALAVALSLATGCSTIQKIIDVGSNSPPVVVTQTNQPALYTDDVTWTRVAITGCHLPTNVTRRMLDAKLYAHDKIVWQSEPTKWDRGNGTLKGEYACLFWIEDGALCGGKFDWYLRADTGGVKDMGNVVYKSPEEPGIWPGKPPAGATIYFGLVNNAQTERTTLKACGPW